MLSIGDTTGTLAGPQETVMPFPVFNSGLVSALTPIQPNDTNIPHNRPVDVPPRILHGLDATPTNAPLQVPTPGLPQIPASVGQALGQVSTSASVPNIPHLLGFTSPNNVPAHIINSTPTIPSLPNTLGTFSHLFNQLLPQFSTMTHIGWVARIRNWWNTGTLE